MSDSTFNPFGAFVAAANAAKNEEPQLAPVIPIPQAQPTEPGPFDGVSFGEVLKQQGQLPAETPAPALVPEAPAPALVPEAPVAEAPAPKRKRAARKPKESAVEPAAATEAFDAVKLALLPPDQAWTVADAAISKAKADAEASLADAQSAVARIAELNAEIAQETARQTAALAQAEDFSATAEAATSARDRAAAYLVSVAGGPTVLGAVSVVAGSDGSLSVVRA